MLLCFGAGNFIGSVAGGRYSDRVFNQLKAQAGGQGTPEMRIQSTVSRFSAALAVPSRRTNN